MDKSEDSDYDDLEVQMYSELYFEPNPDYIPVSENSTLKPKLPKNDSNPAHTSDGATVEISTSTEFVDHHINADVPPQNGDITSISSNTCNKIQNNNKSSNLVRSRRRFNSTSSVHSISGSVRLDSLYCRNTSPIHEECSDGDECSVEEIAGIKVSQWMSTNLEEQSNVSKLKRKKMEAKKDSDVESIEIPSKKQRQECEVILVDSDSDAKTPDKKQMLSRKSVPAEMNSSKSVSFHNFLDQLRQPKPGTQITHTPKLKKNAKKIQQLKPTGSLQFVMDNSSDSSNEPVDLNGSIVTNLSMNYNNSALSTPISNLYQTDKDETCSQSTPRNHKRAQWPLDFTAQRVSSATSSPALPHWTPHMVSFYDSDVSEEFDIDHLHKKMPKSRIEWELDDDDLPFKQLKKKKFGGRNTNRYFTGGGRCTKCRQFDHNTQQCTKLLHCILCGETDHWDANICPKNICFRCGGGQHTFCQKTTAWNYCNVCNRKGHVDPLCPDIWRRYCYTISGSVPVQPPPSAVSRTPCKTSCFSCGKPGHRGHECSLKVPSYVVLPYDVVSFDSPVKNVLGKQMLKTVEVPELPPCEYGEFVTVHTPSRASVGLSQHQIGLLIGKKGIVVKTIRKQTRCNMNVIQVGGEHRLDVNGENIDPAIRISLFLLGGSHGVDFSDLEPYMLALDTATNTSSYTNRFNKWKKQNGRIREIKKIRLQMKLLENNDESPTVDIEENIIVVDDSVSDKSSSDIEVLSDTAVDADISKQLSKNISQSTNESINYGNKQFDRTEETMVKDYDSKFAAVQKLSKRKDHKYTQVVSLSDSDNSSLNTTDSDVDSTMQDYIENSYFGGESSDASSQEDVGDSGESDLSSEDEAFNSDRDEPNVHFCDLDLTYAHKTELKEQKVQVQQEYMRKYAGGRQHLISVIKNNMLEFDFLKNDPMSLAQSIRDDCASYNIDHNENIFETLQEKVKLLGKIVLGKLQLDYGKDLLNLLKSKLYQLEKQTDDHVNRSFRKDVSNIFQDLCEVSVTEADVLLELIYLKAEQEDHHRTQKRKYPTNKRRYSDVPQLTGTFDHQLSKKTKRNSLGDCRKMSKKKSPKYPMTFTAVEDLEGWSSCSPKSGKSSKSLSKKLRDRLTFCTKSTMKNQKQRSIMSKSEIKRRRDEKRSPKPKRPYPFKALGQFKIKNKPRKIRAMSQ